jgi:hypothetical protein
MLAHGHVDVAHPAQVDRRLAVALHLERDALAVAPLLERRDEAVGRHLRQRAPEIAAHVAGLRRGLAEQQWQQRLEIVAAPPRELVEQARRPVGLKHLQAVAPERADAGPLHRLPELLSGRVQMRLKRAPAVVIEHIALIADRSALHHHARGHRHHHAVAEGGDDLLAGLERLRCGAHPDHAGRAVAADPRASVGPARAHRDIEGHS